MKAILILLLIFYHFASQAQVAIIQDKDGFTNVRKQPDNNSEIIYQIKTNEVFWFGPDGADNKGDWVPIFISKNKFSLDCSGLLEGFIHKSKLKPLIQLATYKEDDFNFKYFLKPFEPTKHVYDLVANKFIEKIDGRHPWGIDGFQPKIEVEKVVVSIKGNKIQIPEALFGDIYECTNNFSVYRIGDTYFVYQHNSDGAGGYELVWVITKEGVIQRLVGSIV